MNDFMGLVIDKQLKEILRYYFDLGGKRIRPTLFYTISKAFGSTENLVPYSLVLELIHTMSLYHDDVIDDAEERRGSISVHKKWDVPTAIVGGDIFHGLIHNYLLHCLDIGKLKNQSNVIRFLSGLIIQVELPIGNSVLKEMRLACGNAIPDLETANEVARGKTAPLFAFSLASAGRFAGLDEDTCTRLFKTGMNLGYSFQLLDDVSDYFENDKGMGKDLRDDRKTPILVLANQHDPTRLVEYRTIAQTLDDQDIISFRKEFSSVFLHLIKQIQNQLEKTVSELSIIPENMYKETILTLIQMMEQRCKLYSMPNAYE